MESSLSESVQQLVRPGKCTDVFYPDPETAKKQCFRTTQNTRYVQAFTNLTGGSSVFTIPPNNGIQDIIITFELPALSNANANGLGLNRGWGYSLIKQVSFRYGGSSQYFLSGAQILQNALRKSPNGFARDDILSWGGSFTTNQPAAVPPIFGFANPQRAYVWLSLPHCTPTAEGKMPPLPTDLLTQQVQVTCEIYNPSTLYSQVAGSTGTIPTSGLSFAEFQVQQVILENQGDALARRVDMTSHALSYPIEFTQQEVVIPLANASAQQLTATGFRAGEVKNIQMWVTKDSDTSGAVKNPLKWYPVKDITMTYAGEVYARFDKGSAGLWNLVNSRISPQVNDLLLADNAAGAGNGVVVGTASADVWTELPFAQSFDPVTAHTMYMAGKNITNGIVNISFSLDDSVTPAADYKLHLSYNYNAVLTFSQGTCDYVL